MVHCKYFLYLFLLKFITASSFCYNFNGFFDSVLYNICTLNNKTDSYNKMVFTLIKKVTCSILTIFDHNVQQYNNEDHLRIIWGSSTTLQFCLKTNNEILLTLVINARNIQRNIKWIFECLQKSRMFAEVEYFYLK